MPETKPHENPLVPNSKLKQMYQAMAGARALDDWLSHRGGKRSHPKFGSTRGEEACRVATSVDLNAGDLVSDARPGILMEFLAGAAVETLARGIARTKPVPAETPRRMMPWIEDAEVRLQLVLGAALAIRMSGTENIALAYAYPDELTSGAWQRVLNRAGSLELPVILVVLPSRPLKGKDPHRLPVAARRCGVPAITVDAADAVALYRVMQESLGRVRHDGGPVVIECLAYRPAQSPKTLPADPVLYLKEFLLRRKIARAPWIERAPDAGSRRIDRIRKRAAVLESPGS